MPAVARALGANWVFGALLIVAALYRAAAEDASSYFT
jgi:hypothetical protein